MRSILFTAVLIAATPVLAQETAPAAASVTATAEAAFQARAEAFQGRIRQMGEEMGAAIAAAGPDRARRTADLDAIQSRYQPEMDAFATALEAFVLPQIAALPADQQSDARAGVEAGMTQLRGLPATMRAQAEQAFDNPQ